MKLISIIIPVYNESVDQNNLLLKLEKLCRHADRLDIIIAVAGESEGLKLSSVKAQLIKCDFPGRGIQMNEGAKKAKGEILYFLHADSLPPKNFDNKIEEVLSRKEIVAGCFRLKFDPPNPILNFYSFFSRFKHNIFHGGDASLFVWKKHFEEIKGFDEGMILMEDYDIIRRISGIGKFAVLKSSVITSARKYTSNGTLRLQFIYIVIQIMYRFGWSQKSLSEFYQKHVK